jgi:hypothetical protein
MSEAEYDTPWLFIKPGARAAFDAAMNEDAAMKGEGRTPIEALRSALDLAPCDDIPGMKQKRAKREAKGF